MYWLTMEDKITKINQLRNNEYYCMQEVYDELYKRARENYNFYDLIKYIENDNNLRLAYRNIKTNHGSKTKSLSGRNLVTISNQKLKWYLKQTKNKLKNYIPQKIKRVGIPKKNGKIRYLGIQEPEEKIIEQAIYQILNPIVTAKFHNNSNGFIQGKSCRRAIAQMENYIIKEKLYYVVDIDIKGFFDNISHGKLLKQLWTIGIKDKNLLKVISKMLKAEIFKIGIPEKGTPQGGILSPLLANVVLNELDWWLENKKNKGIRFVRYADDFKILSPTYSIARNMLDKTTRWLEKRLKLQVSEEKTKIVNLKRNYSEFLGIKLKITKNKGKIKIKSHMNDKAIESSKEKLKKQIRIVKKSKGNPKTMNNKIDKYNSQVMGIQNYYNMASLISEDLSFINYIQLQYIYRNFKDVLSFNKKNDTNNYIENTYSKIGLLPYIRGKPIIPIGYVKYSKAKYKGNKVNYFDGKNRELFHKELKIENIFVLWNILKNPYYDETVEFNDNILSKFCGQYGKYAITNQTIYNFKEIEIIRKNNKLYDNKYNNLIIVNKQIKKLLTIEKVDDIIEMERLTVGTNIEQLGKINKIRKENNLSLI